MILLLLACQSQPQNGALPAMPAGPAAASAPAATMDGSGVVAQWNGGMLNYSDIKPGIESQLRQLETEYLQNRYNLEFQAIEQASTMKLIEAEAAKRGITPEALLKAEVEDKVAKPSESEQRQFYEQVKAQAGNAPFEQVQPQVEGALMQRRQGERMEVWLGELKASYGLQTQLPYPDVPRVQVSVDDDPVRGSPEAVVTIVEFSDFQCGYCRKIHPTLQELLTEYDGKVKLVYRDYPLGGMQGNLSPMIAANCSGAQGKYWEMHDKLMTEPARTAEELRVYAQSFTLDMDAYDACVANAQAQVEEIGNDAQAGQAAGVSGTPAFFINGVMLPGAVPKAQFKAVIDREIAAAAAPPKG